MIVVIGALFFQPWTFGIPQGLFWALLLVGNLCIWLLALAIIAILLRERLLVTNESITTWRLGSKQKMQWDNVVYFIRLESDLYALKSPASMLILSIIQSLQKSPQQPDAPFDEYQRKMDALLVFITNRTGLPLTDLRDVTQG